MTARRELAELLYRHRSRALRHLVFEGRDAAIAHARRALTPTELSSAVIETASARLEGDRSGSFRAAS